MRFTRIAFAAATVLFLTGGIQAAGTHAVSSGFGSVRVYPNPWRADQHAGRDILFTGLPADTTIKIFTTAGNAVRSFKTSAPSASWDLKNDSGDRVASGLYIYSLTDGTDHHVRGKIAVIQ